MIVPPLGDGIEGVTQTLDIESVPEANEVCEGIQQCGEDDDFEDEALWR